MRGAELGAAGVVEAAASSVGVDASLGTSEEGVAGVSDASPLSSVSEVSSVAGGAGGGSTVGLVVLPSSQTQGLVVIPVTLLQTNSLTLSPQVSEQEDCCSSQNLAKGGSSYMYKD